MAVKVGQGCMALDDERSLLFSGEVEYWRLEPRYWRCILERLAETGMEWVSSYVPWRVHEQGRHEYDLEGRTNPRLNLPSYLDIIKEVGLKLYFRPGPLIVSEMAAGGYPDWLVKEDPSILVWDFENNIPYGFGGKGNGGVPCYLHPEYLEHCRVWLAAVNEIARDYVYPDGPIALYQLDNEVSLVCKDGMFQSDYNPHIVGPGGVYHQWLEVKYGSVENVPYREGSSAIQDIKPPRSLEGWGEKPIQWWWDWAEFKEYYLARYVEELRLIHEGCGIKGTVFCTNLNPHRPNTLPNNWKKYEAATQGLVGYDFYRSPFLSYTGYLSLSRICRMLGAWMPLPWSAEFMGGFWHENYEGGSYPHAEHHEFMAHVALAHGLKGIAWYMFHDRERWGGSPVSGRGHRRYSHEALTRVMSFANGCKDFASLKVQGRVGVLHYRPYHVHTFLGDPHPTADNSVHVGRPEIAGVKAGLASVEYEGIFGLLLDAGYSPIPVDPDVNPEALRDLDALWVTTEGFMDAQAAGLLWDFARGGGTLIVGPHVPGVTLSGESLALPDGLGEPSLVCDGDRIEVECADDAVVFYGGVRTHCGEPVLELGGAPVVSRLELGDGLLFYVGGHVAQEATRPAPEGNVQLVRRLLDMGGVKPLVHTDRRDVHAVLQRGADEAYLFVLNTGIRAQTVTVTFLSERPAQLRDVYDGETMAVAGDGRAVLDVDCKRARVFELIGGSG